MGYLYLTLAVIAAVFFYWLRARYRILYGLSEIAVSILILVLIFIPPTKDSALLISSGSPWFPTLTNAVSLFAGIYAFVRGLDNIVSTLRNPF
jgi:hypothetical protein